MLCPRRTFVEVVESGLPDRNDTVPAHRDLSHTVEIPGLCLTHRVWVQAGCAEDSIPILSQVRSAHRVGHVRRNHCEARDPGLPGPAKHCLPVIPEGDVSQMAMTVEVLDHTVAG